MIGEAVPGTRLGGLTVQATGAASDAGEAVPGTRAGGLAVQATCAVSDAAPWTGNGYRLSNPPSPITLCVSCLREPLPLSWCDAYGEYRASLELLLHALKFRRHDFLDDALASLLEETVRARGDLAFDAIVGVPMAPAKERRRGYNQAHLLARALGRRLGLRCDMTLLGRAGERATQSTLPKRDRAANVRGAFSAASRVKGKSILVVDDICTTGETLRACATALLREGASRVCAVTVAKAS